MRKENIDLDLSALAFDFFYWFSRLEFALKENGYLTSHRPGQLAEPSWREFVNRWEGQFQPSREAQLLLELRPQVQVVGNQDSLEWAPVRIPPESSTLAQVVRLLKTVRNNLFHGGKHGVDDWDSPARTKALLVAARAVLHQLAQLGSIEPDFSRYY